MLFRSIATRLRGELGEELFSSWFARMEAEEVAGTRLTVSVPTRFLQNWVRTHYYENLLSHADSELSGIDVVAIKVRARGVPIGHRNVPSLDDLPQDGTTPPAQHVQPDINRPQPASISTSAPSDRGSPLDHNLTFETFVTGGSNSLAHAAARRITETQPGAPVSFNPLYIHAGAGLGKTHLLHAISWRIRQLHPARKVLYLTAERFMYHFLAALKARDVLPFKDYFQSVDVLLIDEIGRASCRERV